MGQINNPKFTIIQQLLSSLFNQSPYFNLIMEKNNILSTLASIRKVSNAVAISAIAVVKTVKTVVDTVKKLFRKGSGPSAGGSMILVAAAFIFGMMAMNEGDGGGSVVMAVAIVGGVSGKGEHVVDGPLTTKLAETATPGLLRNEIDERIVKIRPMSTPLDQISRYGGARLCGSMKVDYYSVDTRPIEDFTAEDYEPDRDADSAPARLKMRNSKVFEPSTTLIVPDIKASTGGSLVLYVVSRDSSSISVISVNNQDEGVLVVPEIPKGTRLVRMGRAAAELDVMTSQFEALPKKDTNYCQIFKTQVEQSTFMKIANKEVGWTFSDQEEAAIIDMRMGMEKNFLFGHKAILTDPEKHEEILLTGGIWNQTDNTFSYSSLASEDALVSLCKQAFTNNAGSSRKVLIGGTGLIEQLHRINHSRVLSAEASVTKWGLDFTEIHSKFGTLYVLLSEVFDQCGMPDAGMVIDPEYITKYSHVPFRTERLDLRSAGVRNTDAIVITEASCLVLRYPKSHLRIVKSAS